MSGGLPVAHPIQLAQSTRRAQEEDDIDKVLAQSTEGGYPRRDPGVADQLLQACEDPDQPLGAGLFVCAAIEFLAEEIMKYPSYKAGCRAIAAELGYSIQSNRKSKVQEILKRCKEWRTEIGPAGYLADNATTSTSDENDLLKPIADAECSTSLERNGSSQTAQAGHLLSGAHAEVALLKDSKDSFHLFASVLKFFLQE